ncbi:MAG: nitroreductase [Acidimicrobiales bacterium]|nr:nitroreductase [Acidimicrobiales bacterium]
MASSDHTPDPAAAEAARAGNGDYSLFGAAHIAKYEETDGEVGHIWNGAPCLVLTTTGEKSGEERKFALIYGRAGEDERDVVVVASKGGAPDDPQWYRNLVAHPDVTVQVRGDKYPAVARTASADEKPELWATMTRLWPSYDDYQAGTDRDIPVVVISPKA